MATLITLDNLGLYKQLSDAQLNDVKTQLENEIADARLPYKLVDSLPNASADCVETLYLVPSLNTGTSDIYEEYLCVEKDGAYSWEKFGTVSVTEITSTTSGSGNAVSNVSCSGNTITVTYTTLATTSDIANAIAGITAASLGALTSITSSGTKGETDNVVTGVSASGSTVTVTYGSLSASDVTGAVPDSRTVAGHALSSNVTLSLSDISDYAVASEDEISNLFS